MIRGALRGRPGWISGTLEDRARRGVTKAIVHAGTAVEILSIASLRVEHQRELFAEETTPEMINYLRHQI